MILLALSMADYRTRLLVVGIAGDQITKSV